MQLQRTTIMILVPGRNAVSLDLNTLAMRALLSMLVLPLLVGLGAQRCWDLALDGSPLVAAGSLQRATHHVVPAAPTPAARPAPAPEPDRVYTLMTAVRPPEKAAPAHGFFQPLRAAAARAAESGALAPAVISVKSIMQSLSLARRRSIKDVDPGEVPINGVLRLQALHLGETLSARPFDDLLRPDPRAFLDVNHLMRCRVTGHEIEMDPRLIGILAQLSAVYGRTLQLISGHRAPNANGTSPTSQHTLGRAADIRIPGVSIEALKRMAVKLGARGVGLYPEKGFVHVDVRQKQRYQWVWTARGGEQSDMGFSAPPRNAQQNAVQGEGGEESDMGATAPEHAHAEPAIAPESPAPELSAPAPELPAPEPSAPAPEPQAGAADGSAL